MDCTEVTLYSTLNYTLLVHKALIDVKMRDPEMLLEVF